MTQLKKGDRVVVDPQYPGVRANVLGTVYVVDRVNPKNVVCYPAEGGGRGINYPRESLLAAPPEGEPVALGVPYVPVEFFDVGAVVTLASAWSKYGTEDPFVVIKDDGGDRVNIAPLGGDSRKYARFPRRALVKRDLAWLTVHLVDTNLATDEAWAKAGGC